MRGRKPEAQIVAQPIQSSLKPPAWLPADGKAEWKRVLPILITRRTLTDGDLASFANYCAACGTVIQAQKVLAKEGLIFTGATGPKRHPATGIMNDAMTQARQFAAELGLTPVSRSRPSMKDDQDDTFMDL